MISSRTYPAKLLLFGEYTVLSGSQALALPLSRWGGSWVKGDIPLKPLSPPYFEWLVQERIFPEVVLQEIIGDLNQGWQYVADIPVGYGVGSSGAYVAALFDRYLSDTVPDTKEIALILARMESFFHGTSSGMDPLVSYTRHAVVKDDTGRFHTVQDPGCAAGWHMFLLDSGFNRHTGTLVSTYADMVRDESLKHKIERTLIPMVDHAIHFYLSGTSSMLEECVAVISQFQREYFTPMIPEPVKQKWDGLTTLDGVHVKLCGAGGGGFFIVLSTKETDLSAFDLIAV